MPSLISLLADVPLFEGVAPTDVARVASAFTARTYARGEAVDVSANGRRTLILAQGAVRLVRSGPDQRFLGVGLLAEGGLFGQLPFTSTPPAESAETLIESRVLLVQTSDLERIAGAYPVVAANLLSEVGARLAATNDRLAGLAFQSVPARLAAALEELSERYGRMTPRGVRIDLRLTHGQLAELVSTTRETLTKVAGWLRSEGIATLGRREIWIDDPAGLEEVATGARQMPGRGVAPRRAAPRESVA
jgi:CRP/FNR family cyclic AMP-dependent transcriptional regulator